MRNDMNWFDVCSTDDIPLRGARCVKTPLGPIGLLRIADGRIFAIEDRCPHRGGPLTQGIVHGTAVTCPLHNWAISLETGAALGADNGATRTFAVRAHGGRVWLALETRMVSAA